MPAYDRNFDYGLRGARETLRPRRVTARYNLDYVRDSAGESRPLNYTPYGGSLEAPVGGVEEYTMPYMTRGGTRTYRGGSQPIGWERGRTGRGRYDRDFGGQNRDREVRDRGGYYRGGMQAGMDGAYRRGEPRGLRESRPTSEWTRWF